MKNFVNHCASKEKAGKCKDIDKERFISNYPLQLSISEPEQIAKQMKYSVCKIYIIDGNGTGFFCKVKNPNESNFIHLLITDQHVLNNQALSPGNIIKISLYNEKIMKKIVISEERKIYFNEELDITCIVINPKKDDLYEPIEYLELEDNFEKDQDFFNELYKNKPIYLLHYPDKDGKFVSYGIINEIKDNIIQHLCSTGKGSSGSPIILMDNKKVIGVHYGGKKDLELNEGNLL